MKYQARRIVRILPTADAVITASAIVWLWHGSVAPNAAECLLALLIVPFWVRLFHFFGLYESHRLETTGALLRRIASAHLAGAAALLACAWCLRGWSGVWLSIEFAALSAGTTVAGRIALYICLRIARRMGVDLRHVCVLGEWDAVQRLSHKFSEHPEWGLTVACVGRGTLSYRQFVRYPSGKAMPCATLEEVLQSEVIDEVIIAAAPEHIPAEAVTMDLCERYGILARVLLAYPDGPMPARSVEPYFGEISITSRVKGPGEDALLAKRILDCALASMVIVLTGPLMAVIAFLVKLSSPGPVLFRQKRVGLHSRVFTIYKFRTMIDGAESLLTALAYRNITKGPTFKDPSDFRVTDVGRVLRRFSLDELPQLFNVLRGDMSLVGPRPLPVQESAAIVGEHRRRFSVRPGITCVWQVAGRSNVPYSQWMAYDLEYVDGWSPWLDAKLLLKTIPAVFTGRGAC